MVSIILKPDATKGDISELYSNISFEKFCKELKIITPEEAMDMLKEDLGDDIDDVLDHNPLPTTINIYLHQKFANTDSLEIIEQNLKLEKIVDKIFYNRSLVYQMDKNVKKITASVLVLEILLLLMVFALINNTVRLLIYSKRFEIKTMQLVGATADFIMKPFLTKAFVHGLISSLVTIAIVVIGILYYQASSEDIIQIKHLEVVFAMILIAGTSITVFSTFWYVTRFFNSKEEDLYV
ncbi:MAG: permease-like cell division protein FtsX [Bacteroidota bacterium]|nr:permease-like cell division protein FtsX [Bacteroidota bacterium]